MIPKRYAACTFIYEKEISAAVFTQRDGSRKTFNPSNHRYCIGDGDEASYPGLVINSDCDRIIFRRSTIVKADKIKIFLRKPATHRVF